MLKIKNLADKGEIYMYGVIVDDTDGGFIEMMADGSVGYQFPAKIREQLETLRGKPLDIHIASDGGDVAAGVAIANMLASHDAPVTVFVDSWAASIASYIAMTANRVIMPENTFLMIHNPAGGAFGEADYLRSVAEWLDKLKNMIAEAYAKHAKDADIEKIRALMDAETWFTAKEASEMFDNVELTASNEIEAVAKLRSGFENAPVNKVREVNDNNIVVEHILEVLKRSFDNEEESGNVAGD